MAISGWVMAEPLENDGYLGAETCAGCHTQAYRDWQKSDHHKSMQLPNAESVLGDFDNRRVTLHGIESRFFTEGDGYFVETTNGDGQLQTFKIDYTFGFFPLQQYLITLDAGHVQALNIAWDSRPKTEGGQRWYHLQPNEEIDPEHPFFWTGHFNNWNSNCAECHSTNLQKNYDAKNHSYATTYTDINVACESCHGPGQQHLELVKSGRVSADNNGFDTFNNPGVSWSFALNDAIANPVAGSEVTGAVDETPVAAVDEVNSCGGCHSRRMDLAPSKPGDDYHNNHSVQLLDEGLYFADGQIQDEVFVLGSFLQSKMHQSGVTCSNCHNPHSGKLVAEGNAVCAQCHMPSVFDQPKHHQHPAGSEGAQCVNCHMPERTYMGVDARRDHSFNLPNIGLSEILETPLACKNCHTDKAASWFEEAAKAWPNQTQNDAEHWGHINAAARSRDRLVAKTLASVVDLESDLVGATLLQQLAAFPSRMGVEAAQKKFNHQSPLIRRAAVASLAGVPLQMRWDLLAEMMNDSHRSVRFEVAVQLLDANTLASAANTSSARRASYQRLMDDYRASLLHSQDTPSAQLGLAQLAIQQGEYELALAAYQQALRIAPSYVPALINLADFYRSSGREVEAKQQLQQALEVAPDSSDVQHSYGLMLIRARQYGPALPYLKTAFELDGAQPRYAYVYAVALENQQRLKAAIAVLDAANERWPNQTDLLLTLVRYLEKDNQINRALRVLSDLSRIAPSSPQVRQLFERLQTR